MKATQKKVTTRGKVQVDLHLNSSQFNHQVNIQWHSKERLFRQNYFVSIQKPIEDAYLSLVTKEDTFAVINVVWLDDNYKKFENFPQGHSCMQEIFNVIECLQLFPRSKMKETKRKIYTVSTVTFPLEYFEQKDFVRSWNEASHNCRSTEGHLPIFTDREQLKELIALLKLSEEAPLLEAIFIGLNLHQNGGKVKFYIGITDRICLPTLWLNPPLQMFCCYHQTWTDFVGQLEVGKWCSTVISKLSKCKVWTESNSLQMHSRLLSGFSRTSRAWQKCLSKCHECKRTNV